MKLRTVYQVRIAGRTCGDWGETLDATKAQAALEHGRENFHRPDRPVTLSATEREVFEIGDHVYYKHGEEEWCGTVIEIREDEMSLTAHVMSPEQEVMVCHASPSGCLTPGVGREVIRLATKEEWHESVELAAQKQPLDVELG